MAYKSCNTIAGFKVPYFHRFVCCSRHYPSPVRMDSHIEIQKALRRLPRLAAAVAALQKAVSKGAGKD